MKLAHAGRPPAGTSLVPVFDLGGGVDLAWGIIGMVGGVGSIAALVWIAAKGHSDRHAEDDAREYYDRHGHWPDEEPVRTP
jgi:hypothetical protein